MGAATYNITLERNVDYKVSMYLKDFNRNPIDLTNQTVDAEIKQDYYFPTLETFNIDITEPASGLVELSLTAAQTAALHPGTLQYDIMVKDNDHGTIQRILKGSVTVATNITNLT